jgi:hypothetical protein
VEVWWRCEIYRFGCDLVTLVGTNLWLLLREYASHSHWARIAISGRVPSTEGHDCKKLVTSTFRGFSASISHRTLVFSGPGSPEPKGCAVSFRLRVLSSIIIRFLKRSLWETMDHGCVLEEIN